jgi:hypothetical protein
MRLGQKTEQILVDLRISKLARFVPPRPPLTRGDAEGRGV